MEKIKVTQQQRDNALDALHNMWPSVPAKNVARELGAWRVGPAHEAPDCGSVACFGGWCSWWPAFVAQGVVRSPMGCARMLDGSFAARSLFGDQDLFNCRDGHNADAGFKGSDHKLVTHRLKWLITNSEVIS